MAATSGDGNLQQRQQQPPRPLNGDNFAEEQMSSIVGVWGRDQLCLPARPAEQTRPSRSSHRRRPAPSVWHVSLRALRLCRRLAATGRTRMWRWFAAQPLGQKALQSARHAVAAVERATLWARATTDKVAEDAVPFRWYLMIPVVTVLIVIRTGADLAERFLGLQLPKRSELEPSDSSSDTSSIPPLEPVTSASSSGYSTPTDLEETGTLSCVELTPPPESAGDKTMYFSPVGGMQTKEGTEGEEEEEQQQQQQPQQEDKREEVEGEKAEEKTEEPPTKMEEEAVRATMAVVQPLPTVPSQPIVSEEAEKAAMGAVPPPPPPATSEALLAAEQASSSQPAAATSTAQEDLSKDTKKSFGKIFGKMFARNIPERAQSAATDLEEKLETKDPAK